jgi:hypothetical protein
MNHAVAKFSLPLLEGIGNSSNQRRISAKMKNYILSVSESEPEVNIFNPAYCVSNGKHDIEAGVHLVSSEKYCSSA